MSAPAAAHEASRATLLALSFGHGCSDLCSSAVSALLPFLVVERHYTYAAVGAFVLAASIGGALVQPFIGHYGDRRAASWLMPVGLVVGGVGIGVVGLVDNYAFALLAVAVSSLGIAAFHPEGARWARRAAGSAAATGMSIFSVGGGAGYALGPLIVAALVVPLGLRGTAVLAALPLAAAVLVAREVRRFHAREPGHAGSERAQRARRADEWWPFARLALLFGLESGIVAGLYAYLPLHLVADGVSPAASNAVSTVMLVSAAVGTLVGGRLADRVGRRLVLVTPFALLVPLIALAPSLAYVELIPLVVVIGLAMNANASVIIVLAQEYLPGRLGLASGITVGMSIGMGGLVAALLGLLGDAAGPTAVLYVVAALPLLAGALAISLPRPAASSPESIWSRALRESFGR